MKEDCGCCENCEKLLEGDDCYECSCEYHINGICTCGEDDE